MNGRLAIDFGTSTTLLAMWDDVQRQARILPAPEYGRLYTAPGGEISAIPSLIHYAADRRQWAGEQVAQLGLADSARTFRWMKRYIANRSPVTRRIDDRDLSHAQAGADFLGAVLVYAAGELGLRDEEIALTVPVEAFEHYENWLLRAAEAAGFSRCRLIDEASAAALGYGAGVPSGQALLVFDFGGGTLDVSIALLDETTPGGPRRCRVLGKAGADLGGASVDQWLYEDVVRRSGRDPSDPIVRRMGRRLLAECEALKIALSSQTAGRLAVSDPETGLTLATEYTRADFEALLEQRGFRSRLDRVLRRALNAARERGYDEDRIGAALMVGGGSLMPVAQSVVRQIFGPERVRLDRPLDAVARGAAAFAAGAEVSDHIQHSYALRYVNREKGDYDFRQLVARGTPYPTVEPVARVSIKASYDGQTRLGLAIFEMAEQRPGDRAATFELVFDPAGAPRIAEVAPADEVDRNAFWMNERTPTFLTVDAPATQGERCFDLTFRIDANKRLTLSAVDARTGSVTLRDLPVVRLN